MIGRKYDYTSTIIEKRIFLKNLPYVCTVKYYNKEI